MSGTKQCRVLAERLSAALSGDLAASECRRLKAHARTCQRCASIARELERAAGLCRRAGEAPLPAVIRRRARDRAQRLVRKP